jgi:hypothetical protein
MEEIRKKLDELRYDHTCTIPQILIINNTSIILDVLESCDITHIRRHSDMRYITMSFDEPLTLITLTAELYHDERRTITRVYEIDADGFEYHTL